MFFLSVLASNQLRSSLEQTYKKNIPSATLPSFRAILDVTGGDTDKQARRVIGIGFAQVRIEWFILFEFQISTPNKKIKKKTSAEKTNNIRLRSFNNNKRIMCGKIPVKFNYAVCLLQFEVDSVSAFNTFPNIDKVFKLKTHYICTGREWVCVCMCFALKFMA